MRKFFYVFSCLLIVAVASWVWTSQAGDVQVSDQIVQSSEDNTLREMALQSERIITGQSIGAESRWIENGRVLVTLVTVAVDETVKGDSSPTVTVVIPGGTDANRKFPVAMTYPGAPNIAPEEEVFLFLNSDDAVPNAYSIAGFSAGKFSLVEDEAGNKLVSRDNIKTKVKSGPGVVRGQRRFVPEAEFKNKIKEYLGQ